MVFKGFAYLICIKFNLACLIMKKFMPQKGEDPDDNFTKIREHYSQKRRPFKFFSRFFSQEKQGDAQMEGGDDQQDFNDASKKVEEHIFG